MEWKMNRMTNAFRKGLATWLSVLLLMCDVLVITPIASLEVQAASLQAAPLLNVVDVTPPSVPTGMSVSKLSDTSCVLSWTAATDNVGVKAYNIYRNGVYVATTTASSYTFNNLLPSATYQLQVSAYDATLNKSARSTVTSVTTLPPQEKTPPTLPESVQVSKITSSGATVSWTASTDNVGVKGYNVYVNGAYVKTTAGTSTTISGLTQLTSYSVDVLAFDVAGNRSAKSTAVNFTTKEGQAPSAPSNLASSNIMPSSFKLTWTAATDNVGVVYYNLYRGGIYIATVSGTTTSYNFTGLTADTTYSITVRALDAAGNFTNSTALSVKTLSTLTSPAISTPFPI